MIIVKVKQGNGGNTYEFERYNDAELLISTVLGAADKRTTIEITVTDETEASHLQDEVDKLNTRLRQASDKLAQAMMELQKYEGKEEVA